jgi:hypothetical protein
MPTVCSHLESIRTQSASGVGCVECLELGSSWLHLRRCTACGHVGCCDGSPNRHAAAHSHATTHPLIQSFEPGENWYWCYVDELAFERPGEDSSPSWR